MTLKRRRRGRRPGKQDTRERIVSAAREVFAAQGYDASSIRQIAASAEVDPALVYHYFDTKEDLLRAAVQAPIDVTAVIGRIVDGGPDGLGERLIRTFVSVWDDPVTGPALQGLLRAAVSQKVMATLLREFFATQIVRHVLTHVNTGVDPESMPMRASLVASQLFGLATMRYILRFEPLASASPDTVVSAIGPTIQRYLTAPVL